MITETVYLDRDNVNSIQLLADGVAQDITGTQRATLAVGDVVVDSKYSSGVFDWTTNGATGQLDLTLGHQPLSVGSFTARLTLFDLTYPNGLEWASLVINVKKGVPS